MKEIEQFFKNTGYTSITTDIHGIRKNHKGNKTGWSYKSVEELLKDYKKWLKDKNK